MNNYVTGAVIKTLREKKKMTQSQLAQQQSARVPGQCAQQPHLLPGGAAQPRQLPPVRIDRLLTQVVAHHLQ